MDTKSVESKTVDRKQGERRRERRNRVLQGATITFNNGYGAMQCIARNMSENGALLAFGEVTGLPNMFDIRFAESKEIRKAHVCWRRKQSAGIEFG